MTSQRPICRQRLVRSRGTARGCAALERGVCGGRLKEPAGGEAAAAAALGREGDSPAA